MSPALRSALVRFARGLLYAVLAAAIAFVMQELPALSAVVPGGEFLVPVLMAFLLAADKFIRAKREEPS